MKGMVMTGRLRRTWLCLWKSFLWLVQDFIGGIAYSYGLPSVGIGLWPFSHGREVGDDVWRPIIGAFKPSAHFLLFSGNSFIFYILYIICINITNEATCPSGQQFNFQGVRGLEVRGSIPASSTLYFLVSFQAITRIHWLAVHHALSLSHPNARWPRAISGGQKLEVHHSPS